MPSVIDTLPKRAAPTVAATLSVATFRSTLPHLLNG